MLSKLHIFIIWFFSWIKRHPIKIILLFLVVFSIFPPYKYHNIKRKDDISFGYYRNMYINFVQNNNLSDEDSLRYSLYQAVTNKLQVAILKRFSKKPNLKEVNTYFSEKGFEISPKKEICMKKYKTSLCEKYNGKPYFKISYRYDSYNKLFLGNFLGRIPLGDISTLVIILDGNNLIQDVIVNYSFGIWNDLNTNCILFNKGCLFSK